jgi:hypothetical protein
MRDAGANSSEVEITLEDKVGEMSFQAPSYQPRRGFFYSRKRGGEGDGYGKRDERRGHARETNSGAKKSSFKIKN